MFGIVWIVVYDVGGFHMSVVINSGEVNCVCGCVMDFTMFLVYFWDNDHDIITVPGVGQLPLGPDIHGWAIYVGGIIWMSPSVFAVLRW